MTFRGGSLHFHQFLVRGEIIHHIKVVRRGWSLASEANKVTFRGGSLYLHLHQLHAQREKKRNIEVTRRGGSLAFGEGDVTLHGGSLIFIRNKHAAAPGFAGV